MRLWMLGSGSGGNALVLEEGDERLLVDVGFPARELARRLAIVGVTPESITAAVVTHEHHDHARGAATASRRWRWPVFATPGTVAASAELSGAGARSWHHEDRLSFGDLSLEAVLVSHDAAEPVALIATSTRSGARCGIAYDLGHAGRRLRGCLRELDVLVIEANHDPAMLRRGPYPLVVQDRISGRNGHLCNGSAAEVARDVAHSGLRHVVLAHLSENCNQPALAFGAMRGELRRSAFRGMVHVSSQTRPTGPVTVAPRVAVQLALGI